MKRSTLLTAMLCTLGLAAVSATYAADTDTDVNSGTKSSNAATPAQTNGPGQAATPAMPGNPTAQEKVKANRKKEQELRAAAAARAAAAKQNGDTRPDGVNVERPSVSKPDIERPNISKPEIVRPEIHR